VKSPPNPRSGPVMYSEAVKKRVHSPTTGKPKSSEKEVKTPVCLEYPPMGGVGGRGRGCPND